MNNKILQTAIVSALLMMGQGIALPETARAQAAATQAYQIPAGDLDGVLRQYAAQNKLQLVYPAELVEGKRSAGLSGTYTQDEALRRLLQGSGLQPQPINARTIGLKRAPAAPAAPVKPKPHAEPAAQREEVTNMPAIMVTGTRTLNMDIMRTENDPQPYVVFEREEIERSGAINLEEFFKNELTVSFSAASSLQETSASSTSRINLRGLGTDETLILIDGRRVSGANLVAASSKKEQADINGIPLAAVERIEVLPATASGIYGGGATGGVINIILRRDYSGIETTFSYGGTRDGGASSRRADLSAGLSLEGGKTSVMLTASYSDTSPLLLGDRDLEQRSRQHLLKVNPGYFENRAGVPIVGATPNIRSSNGSPLTLDSVYGGSALISSSTGQATNITYIPVGCGGIQIGAPCIQGLLDNAGRHNLDMAGTAQFGGRNASLTGGREAKTAMLMIRREFTPRVQGFLELNASEYTNQSMASRADLTRLSIAADAPNNPFEQDITVRVPYFGLDGINRMTSKDRRAVGGLIMDLGRDWKLTADLTWNRATYEYQAAIGSLSSDMVGNINSGAVDILRDLSQYPVEFETEEDSPLVLNPGDFTTRVMAIRLAGPLPWSLPGGAITLSSLLERSEDDLAGVAWRIQGFDVITPDRSQSVDAVYVEMKFPFVSAKNKKNWAELFDLQLAMRYDDYHLKGSNNFVAPGAPIQRFDREDSSTNPTIGLRMKPVADLMLRASYGTGYRPPSTTELVPNVSETTTYTRFTDPLRGNEAVGVVTGVAGGNPNLKPEESKSWSAGLVLTPEKIPGFRIAADWSRVKKTNNITALSTVTQQRFEEFLRVAPERVTRGAPSDGFEVGPIRRIDRSLINISKMEVEAIDLAFDYTFGSDRYGFFDFGLDATRLLSFKTQLTPLEPVVENAGTLGVGTLLEGGLKWKANGSLVWDYQAWTLGWRTRFFDSYYLNAAHAVDINQGSSRVPSQIYHDLFGSYRFTRNFSGLLKLFENSEIRFGVNNILNDRPPIDVVSAGLHGYYSPLGDPRGASYYLSIRKSFGGN